MDKNKQLWTTIVVAVIAAVVASVITVSVMGNAMFSPASKIISGVNANACSADDNCEANKINTPRVNTGIIKGDLHIIGAPSLLLDADPVEVTGRINIGERVSTPRVDTEFIKGNLNLIGTPDILLDAHGGDVDVQGTAIFSHPSLGSPITINPMVELPIQVSSFVGNGTAYACINSNGNFFRSSTPCV
ncbi:MAG: hypothetical protein KKD94_01300 [Nanoarchaeota archaeon]|nr:hypothetical protein [Nanoarchaeota archaeon]MBU1988099.1 hypothetical protein [Nanoarchaeota archaeon]